MLPTPHPRHIGGLLLLTAFSWSGSTVMIAWSLNCSLILLSIFGNFPPKENKFSLRKGRKSDTVQIEPPLCTTPSLAGRFLLTYVSTPICSQTCGRRRNEKDFLILGSPLFHSKGDGSSLPADTGNWPTEMCKHTQSQAPHKAGPRLWSWPLGHEMLKGLRGRFGHYHHISQLWAVQSLPGVKASESHPKHGGSRCMMKSFFMSDDLSSLQFSTRSASLLRRLLSFLVESDVFTC